MKITCSTGAMIQLQSFSTKLGIQSGPGDLLVDRLFKTFSIPLVEKLRLSISGKVVSKFENEVFSSVKKVKNWLFNVSAFPCGEVMHCPSTSKDVMLEKSFR